MQRLTQIGVMSLGKVMGMTGVLLGAIIGIPYGLIVILISVVGGASSERGGGAMMGFGALGGIALMFLLPVFYGVASFIGGLIYGLVLNLVLKMSGGLEITIQA